jgi:hypothetical protein
MKTRQALFDLFILRDLTITAVDKENRRRARRNYLRWRDALLRRIESGDRAREALRQVEYERVTDNPIGLTYYRCPWCGRIKPNHESDCPRQIALGLAEPQP